MATGLVHRNKREFVCDALWRTLCIDIFTWPIDRIQGYVSSCCYVWFVGARGTIIKHICCSACCIGRVTQLTQLAHMKKHKEEEQKKTRPKTEAYQSVVCCVWVWGSFAIVTFRCSVCNPQFAVSNLNNLRKINRTTVHCTRTTLCCFNIRQKYVQTERNSWLKSMLEFVYCVRFLADDDVPQHTRER